MWKIGGIAAILALGFSLTASVWAQERVWPLGTQRIFRAGTVESGDFVLKDASGVTRGQLGMTARGPALQLFDPSGRMIWSTTGGPRPSANSHEAGVN